MKVVKSQVILYMYERLLIMKELDPFEVKSKFELEDKTFYRYIQEIRSYYSNMYKNVMIVYCREKKRYFIK